MNRAKFLPVAVALQWNGWHSAGAKLINFFMMARSYGCCSVEQIIGVVRVVSAVLGN